MNQTLILVTDDDEDDRFFIRQALERHIQKVLIKEAENGQEALECIASSSSPKVNIVILDVNMPVMDGFETLKEIRSKQQFKHVPTVMLSTSESSEDVQKAYELGANCFIKKPHKVDDYDKLAQSIHHCFLSVLPAVGT
ncbi:MAG: response regulator [Gorillibacterium sp.]|nr:response regulator [Gorillibacterium sp.]